MFCLSQGLKGPSTMSERTLLLSLVYSKMFAGQQNLSYVQTSSDGKNLEQTTENCEENVGKSHDTM